MIKRRDVLLILWLTFVMVVAWIGFTIYHKWVTSTISPDLAIQIVPIDPNFDSGVLASLRTRAKVAPVYEYSTGSSSATLPTSPTPSPSASPTLPLELSPSPEPSSPSALQQPVSSPSAVPGL